MTGRELNAEGVDGAIARRYLSPQTSLNPRLWQKGHLRFEVRLRLMRVALAFYRFIAEPVRVSDIVITGSNAAYNWTSLSDIDLHLVVNFAEAPCPSLADNFFNTKRALWNTTHAISIRGHAVEVYVEDETAPARSSGVYSLMHSQWVRPPSHATPTIHDSAVVAKSSQYADEIDTLLASQPDRAVIDALVDRLYRLRRRGLTGSSGEFSTENLTFKTLRNLGYLDRLRHARLALEDNSLTLEAAAQRRSDGSGKPRRDFVS